jgi:hypothetical protein
VNGEHPVAVLAEALHGVERRAGRPIVFRNGASQQGANVTSTSSTSVYSDAMVFDWDELPDGIYNMLLEVSACFGHSAAGTVVFKGTLGGVDGASVTRDVSTFTVARLKRTELFLDVEVSGGLGLLGTTLSYRSSTAGTTTCQNPDIVITAFAKGQ